MAHPVVFSVLNQNNTVFTTINNEGQLVDLYEILGTCVLKRAQISFG